MSAGWAWLLISLGGLAWLLATLTIVVCVWRSFVQGNRVHTRANARVHAYGGGRGGGGTENTTRAAGASGVGLRAPVFTGNCTSRLSAASGATASGSLTCTAAC